jgi:phospholipid/cholesterol/gamma-HCH transport system permease protein
MKELAQRQIELLGDNVLGLLNGLGDFMNFTFKTIFWTFKPPYRFKLLLEQVYFIGNKSIFIIF